MWSKITVRVFERNVQHKVGSYLDWLVLRFTAIRYIEVEIDLHKLFSHLAEFNIFEKFAQIKVEILKIGKIKILFAVSKIPILNFFLDDGNAGMRAVAFRDAAAKLLDLDDEAMQGIIGNTPAFEEIQKKVLGTQKVLSGRITSNELYNRNEFMVRDVITMDPKEVLEKIMK